MNNSCLKEDTAISTKHYYVITKLNSFFSPVTKLMGYVRSSMDLEKLAAANYFDPYKLKLVFIMPDLILLFFKFILENLQNISTTEAHLRKFPEMLEIQPLDSVLSIILILKSAMQ